MTTSELTGMPDGSVPDLVRETAEDYTRLYIEISRLKNEHKLLSEKLMIEMDNAGVAAVVVLIGGTRYVTSKQVGAAKLKTKDLTD